MKKLLLFVALISVLGLGWVARNSHAAGTMGRSGFMMFDSSNVVGTPVKDSHGRMIGFIDEVMVDSRGHALAVIYHATAADEDPFLYGDGENTPVPFQELTISKAKGGQEVVLVKTDLKHLDFAPYLDPLKMESRRYESKIYKYYGIQPHWRLSGSAEKSRFMELDSRDLIGVPVKDSHGEPIGFVNEVMVDSGGHALAVIYHTTAAGEDPFLYGNGENTPVPFQELTISKAKGGREDVVLKTDLKHLDFAPSLDPLKMESRRDEISIYEYYGIEPRWTEGGHAVGMSPYRWGGKAQDL